MRRAGAAVAGGAAAAALVAVVLNWLVVREAGDTAAGEVGAITGRTPCPKADGSSPQVVSFAHAPPRCIKASKAYEADLETATGVVTIALDAMRAPATVNNFVVLARYHFYDGVPLEHSSTVQALALAPGYTIADERPPAGSYTVGSVAMTSTGPGTIGGPFFVVVSAVDLAPLYPRFGRVTAGLDVLATASGIVSVTIRER